MHRFWRNFRGALVRTIPDAQIYAQAAAFNSFLALFPMLLVALGLLTITPRLSAAVEEVVNRLLAVLPYGSRQTVVDYLLSFGDDPVKWILLGAGGTIFAGSGAMGCLMQGFRVVQRVQPSDGFWKEQLRALALVGVTFLPWLVSALILVFGRQLNEWAIRQIGFSGFFNFVWMLTYTSLALILAMITLSLIYRFGASHPIAWQDVWPGTFVATGLWWIANSMFAYYVRRVPYGVLYGGLAAGIGLLVWMYLTAVIILVGAAYNAELTARHAETVYVDALRLAHRDVPAAEPDSASSTEPGRE